MHGLSNRPLLSEVITERGYGWSHTCIVFQLFLQLADTLLGRLRGSFLQLHQPLGILKLLLQLTYRPLLRLRHDLAPSLCRHLIFELTYM